LNAPNREVPEVEDDALSYSKEKKRNKFQHFSKRITHLFLSILMRVFVYLLAVGIILWWRGSWVLMDEYFVEWFGEDNSLMVDWTSHILAAIVLILMNTFRSILSPAQLDKEKQFETLVVPKWDLFSRKLRKRWVEEWLVNRGQENEA